MSGDLVLVTAHDVDRDADVAVWVPGEGASVLYMSPQRARALTDETRDLLRTAGGNLAELRRGSAHASLGYLHWHEYVEREFGDLFVYRLATGRASVVAERQALVASMTVAGYTIREQRDALGASLGTIHGDQRTLGLVPDKPSPVVDEQPEPVDPFRGLAPIDQALARVAAQEQRGLTSVELQAEWDRPIGTATGSLSRLAKRRHVTVGALSEARDKRRPYRITAAGQVRLAQVIAERDAAEQAAVA